MERDLKRYKINYDVWFRESTLHESGYVKETIDLLTAKGATYETEDGALWLRSTDFGCDKDDVLRRANGFYTYFAADIAYHRNKFEKRGFDRVINIWGADHHGHVKRLQCALDALGLDGSHRLEIVLMQLVRMMQGGEVVRMSKRTGKSLTLTLPSSRTPTTRCTTFSMRTRASAPCSETHRRAALRCRTQKRPICPC